MAIRVKQIIFDEDLNIQGFNLTGLGRFVFNVLPNGTNPNPTELLYADSAFKMDSLLVRHKLQVGASNTDFFVQKAIEIALNTRNLVFSYDGTNRVVQISERDGVSPVKLTSFTYDGSNRIATMVETTTEGTLTSTYTYVGATIDIATVTRAVT